MLEGPAEADGGDRQLTHSFSYKQTRPQRRHKYREREKERKSDNTNLNERPRYVSDSTLEDSFFLHSSQQPIHYSDRAKVQMDPVSTAAAQLTAATRTDPEENRKYKCNFLPGYASVQFYISVCEWGAWRGRKWAVLCTNRVVTAFRDTQAWFGAHTVEASVRANNNVPQHKAPPSSFSLTQQRQYFSPCWASRGSLVSFHQGTNTVCFYLIKYGAGSGFVPMMERLPRAPDNFI